MHKIFFIIHGIGALFGMAAIILYGVWNLRGWPLLTYIVPVVLDLCFYAVIVCKTTRLALYDDVFFIHWEARRHSRLLLLYLLLFWMYSVLLYISVVAADRICMPLFLVVIYAIHHTSTLRYSLF